MRYKVLFVHGYDNRFYVWEVTARDKKRAVEKMYEHWGSNWDHQVIAVLEVKK